MNCVFLDRCTFVQNMYYRIILTICQDLDLAQIRDFEDPAIGAGILSNNALMFDDHAQVCTVLNTL